MWRGTAHSDAGGIVLWSRAAFAGLAPEQWDDELCESADIERHIEAGGLVPLFLGFDGAFAVEARIGDGLRARELEYVTAHGRGLYRLEVGADGAWISGLEHVGAEPWAGFAVELTPGSWSIGITMIGWDDEPGSKDREGRPIESALPDFIVLARRAGSGDAFATAIEAFERPT